MSLLIAIIVALGLIAAPDRADDGPEVAPGASSFDAFGESESTGQASGAVTPALASSVTVTEPYRLVVERHRLLHLGEQVEEFVLGHPSSVGVSETSSDAVLGAGPRSRGPSAAREYRGLPAPAMGGSAPTAP